MFNATVGRLLAHLLQAQLDRFYYEGQKIYEDFKIQPFFCLSETRHLREMLADAPGGITWKKD